MNAAAGPFMIAATLLGLAGAFKAASPRDTANALRGVGLPGAPWLVRAGGAFEAAVGAYAIVEGDRLGAALVAVSYLLFAGFVAIALGRGVPIATCGCFGKADTPPSLVHVGFDLAAAGAAIAVVVDPTAGMADTVADQPLAGVPYVLLVITGTFLAFLALTALPRTLALVREARTA
ncbi:MAG: MauE/DoxX family redox-associated membrane protein [Acidimicrobiia bacterium]